VKILRPAAAYFGWESLGDRLPLEKPNLFE
jgi:hypothetical protein